MAKRYKPTEFMAPTSHYDKERADHAVNFIQSLKHTKGVWAGKPFLLFDWQEKIIRDLFGTIKENGYRQFNTAFVEICKKAGKSELAAAVALYMLAGDGEEGAEIYGCANDRQQASIVFDVAKDMVLQCPALLKRVKIVESQKRIVYLPTRSIYQALSSEVASKYGYNVHACIFDELLGQPNRKLYDVMTKGSGAARKQPLNFVITTAGSDKNSICYEVHSKAIDIMEGRKHDPTFYPVVYSIPNEADWTDPKVWRAVNPSLGKTVDIEYYKAACASAQQNPAEEMQFRQFHLCQWTNATTRWMPMDKWDACAFPVDPERLRGRTCYGGLDLSSTTDITAFVLVFPPEDEDGKYEILPFFWLPEDSIDLRVKRDHVPYDIWQREGLVYTTEGHTVVVLTDGSNAAKERAGDPGTDAAKPSVIAKGAEGADVVAMQKALAALGYDLGPYGIDGDFGEDTDATLREFQKKAGLDQTGIYDAKTREALMAAIDPKAAVDPAPENPTKQVEITGNSVNIRRGNGTQYDRITSRPIGTRMAAVSMLGNMLDQGLIDDADYCALETKYADIFLPLFRYEKPCRNATLPIRQTGKEGRSNIGTYC